MRDLKGYARSGMDGWLRDLVALILIMGIPFLQSLGRLPLIDPDEGRYAEIPREMLERADLITPTLNYVKYFEKPPLLYWLNAASIKLFGVNEFAARFPSAICGLLTVLATYLIARHLYERRTALFAAIVLATSTGFVLLSRIILTDMLLTLCLTVALGGFIVAAQRENQRGSALPWYLFYAFSALAVLTKGLIGIVFPGGIVFLYMLFTGRWNLLGRMRLPSGIALFLLIAAPWFVVVSMRNPEFAYFFFIHEHFERFSGKMHGRYQPFWFFVPVMLGIMFPWSFMIPGALVRAWRERSHTGGRAGVFLLIWILLIFLFFSKSNSKLIPYMLPIFPPLAMLIAHRINLVFEWRTHDLKPLLYLLGGCMALLGLLAVAYPFLPEMARFASGLLPGYSAELDRVVRNVPALSFSTCMVIGLLFLVPGLVALFSLQRNAVRVIMVLFVSSFLLEIAVSLLVMDSISKTESPKELALKAVALAGPDTRIVTFGPMQGVNWYTGRRLLVTAKVDELDFGSRQGDQSAWFPDRDALLRLWGGDRHVMIMLRKGEYKELQPQLSRPGKIVGESQKLYLISNF
jgi:4-amino-4-deoxy-L-arabinose transferase-like glycosyltransferase